MLTQKMYDEMLHDFANDGVQKNYPNLTLQERVMLIKHFAKGPKCPCDKPHTNQQRVGLTYSPKNEKIVLSRKEVAKCQLIQ